MGSGMVRGAVILVVAGFASRLLGLYRLVLPRLIGPEGVGLYHVAYPIYALALALSTGGLPVAISRLVAVRWGRGDPAAARRVFGVALLLLVLMGSAGTGLLLATAPFLAQAVAHDARAAAPLRAVAPAVALVAVLSALRGLHQGLQDMGPPAVSQLIEQAVRVATILSLVTLLRRQGVGMAAAGAVFGAVTGSLAGTVYLAHTARRALGRLRAAGARQPREPAGAVVGELFRLAVPVALSGLALPLAQTMDLALVPRMLAQGAGKGITAVYAQLAGYAMPVFGLVGVVAAGLGTALVPAAAAAVAQGQGRDLLRVAQAGVRLSLLLSFPLAAALWALGPQLTQVLFAARGPGRLLPLLAPGAVLWAASSALAAVLQGMDRPQLPLLALAWGLLAKGAVTALLMPAQGLGGAALGTTALFAASFGSNLVFLRRHVGNPVGFRDVARLLASSACGAAAGVAVRRMAASAPLPPVLTLGASLAGLMGAYAAALVALRAVGPGDLELLPPRWRTLALRWWRW